MPSRLVACLLQLPPSLFVAVSSRAIPTRRPGHITHRRTRQAASRRRPSLTGALALGRPPLRQTAWLQARAGPYLAASRLTLRLRPRPSVLLQLALRTLLETGSPPVGTRRLPTSAVAPSFMWPRQEAARRLPCVCRQKFLRRFSNSPASTCCFISSS